MTEQLLEALCVRMNDQGRMIASEKALCDELRISREELTASLRKLQQAGLIEVLSPLPYLVAKRRMKWPGSTPMPVESRPPAYSFKSSLSRSKHLNESYRRSETKPLPADANPLLQEILDTLGETDPTTFRGALRNYSPEVIRAALERVRRMKRIQKNPTAVFRFLLPRIAKDSPSAK